MAKKLYKQDATGIRFVSDRRPGEVRIPNYVYDIWLPLLGADVIGVYSMYCRLERQDTIKKITLDVIAKACRIGKATLYKVNEKLQDCGFITVTAPTGNKRAHHFTTEITIKDPPQFASTQIIEKYQSPAGYEPLSAWLVLESDEVPVNTSEVLTGTSRSSNWNDEDVLVRTSTMLQPSVLQPSSIESNAGAAQVSHSDNDATASYIKAWLEGQSTQPAINQYGNKTNRNIAKQLANAGIPKEKVTAFTKHLAAQPYWKGKLVPITTVGNDIAAWLSSSAAPAPINPAHVKIDPVADHDAPDRELIETTIADLAKRFSVKDEVQRVPTNIEAA